MSVSADLIFERPGQANSTPVAAGEITCSWAVGEAGSLSAKVTADGLRRAGITDPLGWWVRYTHRTAGDWAGVVTDTHLDLGDGTWELAAESWHGLLAARRTARTYEQQSAPAGSLALRAIADVTRDDPSFLRSWVADEVGDPVSLEWRGDDLYAVLRSLADASGQEWTIDADRNFAWRQRVGTRRDGTQLVDGFHITGGGVTNSLKPVVNDLLAISGGKSYRNAESQAFENTTSVQLYGRRQGAKVYASLRSVAALEATARRDVRGLGTPAQVGELEVADVGGIWSELREGDVIWVLIPRADVQKRLRILSRALDVEAGTMTLAGPFEQGVGRFADDPYFEVE